MKTVKSGSQKKRGAINTISNGKSAFRVFSTLYCEKIDTKNHSKNKRKASSKIVI
jgi:hypothetical protein